MNDSPSPLPSPAGRGGMIVRRLETTDDKIRFMAGEQVKKEPGTLYEPSPSPAPRETWQASLQRGRGSVHVTDARQKRKVEASAARLYPFSKRLIGRNARAGEIWESWEGAFYVRPPFWSKNNLRKRYLS